MPGPSARVNHRRGLIIGAGESRPQLNRRRCLINGAGGPSAPARHRIRPIQRLANLSIEARPNRYVAIPKRGICKRGSPSGVLRRHWTGAITYRPPIGGTLPSRRSARVSSRRVKPARRYLAEGGFRRVYVGALKNLGPSGFWTQASDRLDKPSSARLNTWRLRIQTRGIRKPS